VFQLAAAGFHAARDTLAGLRDDIVFEDSPAPRRLAPYATAIGAAAYRDEAEDDEIGSGRLVLLYDPDGQPGWTGVFRLVALVRAAVEEEMAADPLLGAVGWSWLLDALDAQHARYTAVGGTVTQTISTRFGDLANGGGGDKDTAEVELRASWTALDADLSGHLRAWCELLCSTGGLPPEGVSLIDR
jgi:hypothetical protein